MAITPQIADFLDIAINIKDNNISATDEDISADESFSSVLDDKMQRQENPVNDPDDNFDQENNVNSKPREETNLTQEKDDNLTNLTIEFEDMETNGLVNEETSIQIIKNLIKKLKMILGQDGNQLPGKNKLIKKIQDLLAKLETDDKNFDFMFELDGLISEKLIDLSNFEVSNKDNLKNLLNKIKNKIADARKNHNLRSNDADIIDIAKMLNGQNSKKSLIQENVNILQLIDSEISENIESKLKNGKKIFAQEIVGNKGEQLNLNIENQVKDFKTIAKSATLTNAKYVPKAIPNYVLQQVAKQLIASVQNNQNEITLQLKPPHLGKLQMSIDASTDAVKISIIAENQTAKDLLQSNSNELKSVLAEQGISFDKLDVEISQNFDRSLLNNLKKQNKNKGKNFKNNVNKTIQDNLIVKNKLLNNNNIINLIA